MPRLRSGWPARPALRSNRFAATRRPLPPPPGPRRRTKSETEIDGVYLRLRAQALPPEEGKSRILVTIGEAGEEGVDIRRQLSGSVARLKPGLDWLAPPAPAGKETDRVPPLP